MPVHFSDYHRVHFGIHRACVSMPFSPHISISPALYCLLLCFTAVALGASSRDEVLSLPGWEGRLPSRIFSGFVSLGAPPSGVGDMLMHYVFVEAE